MKIWLDTTNPETVKHAIEFGLPFGVTTNPALIAGAGKPMESVLRELLDLQDGPVTAQVIAHNAPGMIQQGKELYDFSDRIVVKIPITKEGLQAIRWLSQNQIPVMATVLFQPYQGLLAALAGAQYVAPYLSKIELNGSNPWEILSSMTKMYQHYHLDTKILAASISSLEQIQTCAEMGIPHITLKESTFNDLLETNSLTQERVNHFTDLWEQRSISFLSSQSNLARDA
jgi:transaldolase